MATATVEQILETIATLPANEQTRLRQALNQQPRKKEPLGKFVDPISEPDQQGAMNWLADHGREYVGQWVVLDGYRLIAHSADYSIVRAAAKDSGVYLPMITFVEPIPDRPFVRV